MAKELNNPTPGSDKEQPEKGTEGKEKEEVTLPDKFKDSKNPLKDVLKAYGELESHLGERDETNIQMRERLAKLEGAQEAQEKAERRLPEITPEERTAMTKQFKDDFNKDPLIALHNFNAPFMQDVRVTRERAEKLRKELDDYKGRQREREMRDLAAKARGTGEKAKLFDEMTPKIQEELKTNKAWEGFDNPPEAVFYHLLGKSTKNLARVDDEGRESFVEGSSQEPPEAKGTKEGRYKEYIMKHSKRKTIL